MADHDTRADHAFTIDTRPGQVRLQVHGPRCDTELLMPPGSARWLAHQLQQAADTAQDAS